MKVPRAITGKFALVLIALAVCIAALVAYEMNRFDRLARKVQSDITNQGALAHAIVQYGVEHPDVRVEKFELCMTCQVSVEFSDWSTAWHFTMRVESKEGVQMIAVRVRRAVDNTWFVSLRQA